MTTLNGVHTPDEQDAPTGATGRRRATRWLVIVLGTLIALFFAGLHPRSGYGQLRVRPAADRR